jgi:hypothetical protein
MGVAVSISWPGSFSRYLRRCPTTAKNKWCNANRQMKDGHGVEMTHAHKIWYENMNERDYTLGQGID